MSATVEREKRVTKIVASLKPLLKEYIARIEKIGDQVLKTRRAYEYLKHTLRSPGKDWVLTEFRELTKTFARIRPDAEDVDRRASGLIEHAGLDEIDRSELLLRLAELESAITITESRISGAMTNV